MTKSDHWDLGQGLAQQPVELSTMTPGHGRASRAPCPICADVWPWAGLYGRALATGGNAAPERVKNKSARHGTKRVPKLIWTPQEVNQWIEECITFRLN